MNENGERFAETCAHNNIVIGDSFFHIQNDTQNHMVVT